MTHPNEALVRRFAAALTHQDRDEIVAILHEDVVWRVPGRNPLTGTYEGRAAVLAFFGRLRRVFTGPAKFEITDIATSADRAIAYQHGVVVVHGTTVRMKECMVYRIADGQIVEVDEFQYDAHAFDEAFTDAASAVPLVPSR